MKRAIGRAARAELEQKVKGLSPATRRVLVDAYFKRGAAIVGLAQKHGVETEVVRDTIALAEKRRRKRKVRAK